MNVRLWNDADRGKTMYMEKNLSCCHLIHHKYYHMPALGLDLCQHSERPVTTHITHQMVMGYMIQHQGCSVVTLFV